MRNLNKTDPVLKKYISFNLIFTVVGCLLFCACPNWFKCGNNASSDDSDNQTVEQAEQKIDEANKEIDEANEEIAQAKTEEEKRKAEDKKEIAVQKKEIALAGKTIAEKKQEMAQAKTEEEKAKAAVAAARAAAAAARAAANKAWALSEQLERELVRYKDAKVSPALAASHKVNLLFSVAAPELVSGVDKSWDALSNANHKASTIPVTAQQDALAARKAAEEAEKALQEGGNKQAAAEKAIKQFNAARKKLAAVEKISNSQDLKDSLSVLDQEVTNLTILVKQAEKACHDRIKNASEPVQKRYKTSEQLYAEWEQVYQKKLKAYWDFKQAKGTDLANQAYQVYSKWKKQTDEAKEAFEKAKTALQALLKKP